MSLLQTSLLFLLLVAFNSAQFIEDLKPCFERYFGEKLINLYPYHSEWRMKAAENCLEFCAASSSRCKSIVYERHEHICHYFLEDGVDNAVPSTSSIYLKVTAKECLDRAQKLSDISSEISATTQPSSHAGTLATKALSTTTAPLLILNHYNKTFINPTPKQELLKLLEEIAVDSADYIEESANVTPVTQARDFANQQTVAKNLSHVDQKIGKEVRIPNLSTETLAAISGIEEIQSTIPLETAERSSKHGSSLKLPPEESKIRYEEKPFFKTFGTARAVVEKEASNDHLEEYLKQYKQDKHGELRRAPTKKTGSSAVKEIQPETIQPTEYDNPELIVPRAQSIEILSDDEAFKTEDQSEEAESVLQPPKTIVEKPEENEDNNKVQDTSASSYIPMAQSFVASLNEAISDTEENGQDSITEPQDSFTTSEAPTVDSGNIGIAASVPKIKLISMKMTRKEEENFETLPACRNDEIPLWVTVENAAFEIHSLQKKTDADSVDSCKSKCNLITNAGRDCPAFTYDEMEHTCVIYTSDSEAVDSLSYIRPDSNDFNIRTSSKFCYPKGFVIFKKCTELTAFHDYVLDIVPREEFDGMPKGREGLHACLELCILSPHYYCKSATFLSNEGICRLNEENSLSKPEAFREAKNTQQIYFENTCARYFTENSGYANTRIERVTITPPLKPIRIQPKHNSQQILYHQFTASQGVPSYPIS